MNIERSFRQANVPHKLDIARNGQEALSLLNERKSSIAPLPDIVLLDLNMPLMSGLEFLESIRDNPEFQSLWVFVMSTSDNEKDKLVAHKYNVAGYIVKPLSGDQFRSSLAKLLMYWSICEIPA